MVAKWIFLCTYFGKYPVGMESFRVSIGISRESKLAFGDDDERVKVVSDYSRSLIIYSTDGNLRGTRHAWYLIVMILECRLMCKLGY